MSGFSDVMGFIDPVGSAIGGYDSPPKYAQHAEEQERDKQMRIAVGRKRINQAFAGFGPGFFQRRRRASINAALPELGEQYRTNKSQIGFDLGNRGTLGSSMARKKWSELNRSMHKGQQSIAEQALAEAMQMRQNIQEQRNVLTNQLYQSADPAQAGQAATATAASFATPSVFTPLVNAFNDVAQRYYLSQLYNQYRQPRAVVELPSTGVDSSLPPTSQTIKP